MNILIIGPAGSGKTSLTSKLSEWMLKSGISRSVANLDPGAEALPYIPDYDVRSITTVNELMAMEGLGPNGALVRAAEVIEAHMDDVVNAIESLPGDIKIIDTPGQIEIFLFRRFGSRLASSLKGKTAAIMLLDLSAISGNDYSALRLLGLITELNLGIPSLDVVSKADLLGKKALNGWQKRTALRRTEGIKGELAYGLSSLISELEKRKRIVAVSSMNNEGIEELYNSLGELFCSCGDLS